MIGHEQQEMNKPAVRVLVEAGSIEENFSNLSMTQLVLNSGFAGDRNKEDLLGSIDKRRWIVRQPATYGVGMALRAVRPLWMQTVHSVDA